MKTVLIKFIGFILNSISYVSKPYAANKAIYLFTTPRKGKTNEVQSDFLGTAFREELSYNGKGIMTYRWLGKKKTILLAHGWESNSARWKPLIKRLNKQDFNVVALDAPAHGRSGSKTFNGILYSEFINIAINRFKPEIIIGHSAGGMSAVIFQNKYQAKHIEKLILLGSPSEFSGVLKRYSVMLGYNQRISEGMDSIVIERFGQNPNAISTAKYLKNITSKGLIIHDEDDDIIPYSDAISIKNSFKDSKLITTKGFGHSLNNDAVSSYIEEFIGV